MRIVLTGASGFIGRHLSEALGSRHDVAAVVRRAGSAGEGVSAQVVHDLTRSLDDTSLPDRVDAVIHLAQSERYRDFPEGAEDVLAVNVGSTFALLEYARHAGASVFVYASTGGVYGTSYERFAETDPVNPINFYLSSKYSAELMIANYRHFFRTIVLRPFFVYGPGQSNRMLVTRLVERVRAGETITVQGTPGLRINPIYVADAIRAFEPALALGDSGLFNVAGDEIVTMTQLVETIGELVGRQPVIDHTPSTEDGDLIGDTTRMRDVLGVFPRVTLREGLRATVEHAAQAPA